MKLKDIPDPIWYAIAIAAGGLVIVFLVKKAGSAIAQGAGAAVDAAGAAVNPAADTNLAYRFTNWLSGHGDGSQSSWGTAWSDFVNGTPTFKG